MNRNKHKNALLSLVACLILTFTLTSAVFALPVQQEGVYVYDEANVIPDEVEADINARAKAIFALTGAKIETVCLKNTGDKTTSEYAIELFSEWKLGSSDKNNGILILLSIEGNDYWTMQGSGLKSSLTDSDLQKINNEYLEPDFAAKKYGDGVKKIFDTLLGKLEAIYSVNASEWDPNAPSQPNTAPTTDNTDNQKDATSGFSITSFFRILLIVMLIIAGVVAVVTVFAFIRRPRYVGTGGSKRRHYNTERGAYVSMPPKNDIERARMRHTSERSQNSARSVYPQRRPGGNTIPQRPQDQQSRRSDRQYPQTRTSPQSRMDTQSGVNITSRNVQQRMRPTQDQGAHRRHEHPTVYPERPPYIDRRNGNGSGSGGNGGKK